MNIYKILTLNCGCVTEITAIGYDIISAIQSNGICQSDIIRIELIGSQNKISNLDNN